MNAPAGFMCLLLLFPAGAGRRVSAQEQAPLRHNPWELILYRPEDADGMNEVRCWLRIEDEDGNDVTYSAAKATYEWISIPGVVNQYERTYYLSGGMAMHLLLKGGAYTISFYTPADKQFGADVQNGGQWESNRFSYDTRNPAKVIFVSPTADGNGFYNGGWHIDYRAPRFWRFTQPKRTD